MPKDNPPSDSDVIFNRANVALARSQRLVQSWLPTKSAQETVQSKSEQELLKEDEELFKSTPELLGVGASAPDTDADPLLRKRPGANNDRLLEQLLGKKAARGHRASSKPQPAQKTPTVQKTGTDQLGADEDDEEEGRATMVASNSALKRKGPVHSSRKTTATSPHLDKVQEPPSDEDDDPRPNKKRSGTYLDQLLAEKASKKKRKQQKT
ncbi:MAG: Proline iminopeptidase [Aureobasidium pullulans]|nr:MAG: Proline iminopeptidase [Aureobasidium pullulans]